MNGIANILLEDYPILLFLLMLGGYEWLFIACWAVLDQQYRSYQKQRYLDQGMDPRRAEQLCFEESREEKSELFVSQSWFDIVGFITASNDVLRTRHGRYPWLWDFMPASSGDQSVGKRPTNFENARNQFDLHPGIFIERLEAFAKDLSIQNMSHAMINYVSDEENDFKRLECWYRLQSHISKLMEDPYDRTNLAKNTGAHRTPRLSDAYSFLQSRGTRGGPDSEAASQASKFLDRYLANGRLYEERSKFLIFWRPLSGDWYAYNFLS